MSKPKPSSITIEEAVALIISLDDVAPEVPLLDLLDAFCVDAEEQLEASYDHQLTRILEFKLEACESRRSFAQQLFECLKLEIENPEDSLIKLDDSSTSSQPRMTLDSVAYWAATTFGIALSENGSEYPVTNSSVKPTVWEDVTIKIYANNRIGYSLGQGYKTKYFQDIGLMGQRKNEPNKQGSTLIALSKKIRFPEEARVLGKDKATLSKIRGILKALTGLSNDSFLPFNEHDGYKPRFKLVDDRRNAEDRAKRSATHVSYDESRDLNETETRDFDREDDAAQKFIDGIE